MLVGGRVVGRAFLEAYRQAAATHRYAQQTGGSASSAGAAGAGRNSAVAGLTLDEACKILNVPPPSTSPSANNKATLDSVMERFKRLFDMNDPEKGGSFYLQSKILRARERIELEVREAERAAERDKEVKEGWQPKIYKDR